jgi:hypothetical protein
MTHNTLTQEAWDGESPADVRRRLDDRAALDAAAVVARLSSIRTLAASVLSLADTLEAGGRRPGGGMLDAYGWARLLAQAERLGEHAEAGLLAAHEARRSAEVAR